MGHEWPFVQRDAHLRRIAEAVGRPTLRGLLVVGEAGTGKTRLVSTALERATREGQPTDWVVATRASGGVPFGAVAHLLPQLSVPHHDRVQLLQQTRRHLQERHGSRRLVLGVDDAQLLDDASAALVQHLAATDAAFLLATVRSGEPVPEAVEALLRDGSADRLDVEPLGEEGVAAVLATALGGQVDGAAVLRFARLSEGNPLLLRELISAAQQGGQLRQSAGLWRLTADPVPGQRLVDLVEARLASLPEGAHDVVQALALGEPLEAGILEALFDSGPLEAADDEGLLQRLPDRRRQNLRLVHPLYTEALRAHIPPLRARRIHRRLADALQATGARRRQDVLRLAIWRLEAGQTVGAEVFVAAARQASRVFDHVLAERLARAAQQAGAGFPARLLLAHALRWQGRGDEALAVLEGWQDDAEDDHQRAQAAITVAATLAFAQGQLGEAEDLLAQARVLVADTEARLQLAGFQANLARYQWRLDDALRAAETVLHNPEASQIALAQAVPVAAQVLALSGRADEAVTTAQRVLSSAARGDDLAIAAEELSHQAVCVAHALAGRLRQARAIASERYERALHQRAPALQAQWCVPLGQLALAAGEVGTAVKWLREAAGLLGSVQVRVFGTMVSAWGGGCLAEAAALQGDRDLAEFALAVAENALPAEVPVANRNLGRVWVAVIRGDLSGARGLAFSAAEAALRAGALGFAGMALHDAVRLGLPGAELRGVAGRLAQLAGRDDGEMLAAFAEHAAARLERDGPRLITVGEHLAALDFKLLAAEVLAEASGLFRDNGMLGSALTASSRARELLEHCQGAQTPALAALERSLPLTARELEIARLAAEGLPSRDIAAKLTLSVRTVDNHLHRVYAKLNVSGRAELRPVLGL